MHKSKDEVLKLLRNFHAELVGALNSPRCLAEVDAAARAARRVGKDGKPGNTPWENTLVGRLLVPAMHKALSNTDRMTPEEARALILSENVEARREFASPYRAVRSKKHPFAKIPAGPARTAAAWWATDQTRNGLAPACPDFAVTAPYRIVFEAKYYRADSKNEDLARRTLVREIYQSFYYRALPSVPAQEKGAPPWDYEYAAFVAIDASRQQLLTKQWNNLSRTVKASFWDGGNIEVMVVPAVE